MYYDVKFGRKKGPVENDATVNGQTAGVVCNGNSSNVTSNGNGYLKNTSDMAIYEQYRNQVFHRWIVSHLMSGNMLVLEKLFDMLHTVWSQDRGSSANHNGVSSAGFDEKPYGSLICLK